MPRFLITTSASSARFRQFLARACAAAVAATMLGTPVLAEEAKVGVAGTLADTTKPAAVLKETVVTGSRYQREMYRSPQAMTVMNRWQINQQLAQVPGDALGLVPGLANSKDSPWNQQPVIRGMSGQRVLVLMDGSPVNNVRGRGPQTSLVGSEQVERIEVVRGPGSVAYGSDALGGVINIITRQAGAFSGNGLKGTATIGGSTVDQGRHAQLELMPRVGRLSGYASLGLRKAEDYDTPAGEVQDSGYESGSGLLNAGWAFTEKTSLKAGYQVYQGNDIGIPGLTVAVPGFSQAFRFKDYDRDFVHLTLDHGYANSWLAGTRVRGYWQREKRNFQSDQEIVFGPGPPGFPYRQEAHTDRFFDLQTWGAQLQMTSVKSARTQFTVGVDVARDQPAGTNVAVTSYYDAAGNPSAGFGGGPSVSEKTTMSVPEGDFDSYAGYAQVELFATPQVTVSAGARYTHYRYATRAGVSDPGTPGPFGQPARLFEALRVNDGAFSGSLGLVYEPLTNLYLTANVANGYRQPNAQDLFFDGPASVGIILGNPELDAEQSINADVGVRWGPGDLSFMGNVFYSSYDDLIDAVKQNTTPARTDTFQYFNIAKARIYGAEAEAQWAFLPGWRARAALSGAVGDITSREAIMQLYGIDTDEAPLPSVPPFGGSAALRWSDRQQRFWLEPAARFSWRYNRLPLPPPGLEEFIHTKKEWIAADLYGGVNFPSGQRLVIGLRNLGNTLYQPALASVVEPGFSLVGSISTSF